MTCPSIVARVSSALALLGTLFVAGCAAGLQSPADGGARWVSVSSEHFVVHSDLPAQRAQETLQELESFRLALEQLAFASAEQPKGITRVVLFGSRDEYEDAGLPSNTGGFFGPGLDQEPSVFVFDGYGQEFSDRIRHELVHRYVAFHLPTAPLWLNEGLATFYSTLRVDSGRALLGRAPNPEYFAMQPGMLLGTFVPTVERLRSLDARAFYGFGPDVPDDERLFRATANYGTAWALTHVLALGPLARQKRFLAYLNLITSGAATPEQAWRRNFDGEDRALARDVQNLLSGTRVYVGELPFRPSRPVPTTTRELSAAAVHRLWARTRPMTSKRALAATKRDLDRALALAPDSAETHVLFGFWYAAQAQRKEALAAFSRALRLSPQDPECLYARIGYGLELEEQRPPSEHDYESLQPFVERLESRAVRPAHLNGLGWYWALRAAPDRGLPFARRAVAADSSCAACYDTLALLLAQKNALTDAIEAQHIALNLSEGDTPGMRERLKSYEQHLRALGASAEREDQRARPVWPPAVALELDSSCEKAHPIKMTVPRYPDAARRNGVEGVVLLRFVVRERGNLTDLEVVRGPAVLVEAARAALESWTFSPARCAGHPVASVQEVRVPFKLAPAKGSRADAPTVRSSATSK